MNRMPMLFLLLFAVSVANAVAILVRIIGLPFLVTNVVWIPFLLLTTIVIAPMSFLGAFLIDREIAYRGEDVPMNSGMLLAIQFGLCVIPAIIRYRAYPVENVEVIATCLAICVAQTTALALVSRHSLIDLRSLITLLCYGAGCIVGVAVAILSWQLG